MSNTNDSTQPKTKSGLLIRDEQGNSYYIRAEILEMCRVTGEALSARAAIEKKKQEQGKPKIEMPEISEPDATFMGSIKFDEPLEPEASKLIKKLHQGDTYMCPW